MANIHCGKLFIKAVLSISIGGIGISDRVVLVIGNSRLV